jgi:hypothetical protein
MVQRWVRRSGIGGGIAALVHGGTGVAWALAAMIAMATVLLLVLAIKEGVYLRVRGKSLSVGFEPKPRPPDRAPPTAGPQARYRVPSGRPGPSGPPRR